MYALILFRNIIEENNKMYEYDDLGHSYRKKMEISLDFPNDTEEAKKKPIKQQQLDEESSVLQNPLESSLHSILFSQNDWKKYDLQLQEVDEFIRDLKAKPEILSDQILSQQLHDLVDDELLNVSQFQVGPTNLKKNGK